ncbi:hypothetical protein [Agromyces sp. NPDC049794]|uniref:hypothetical protein n=1 Tax=unclassified Agromyces TaxID=2639701 RepID=UPI0033E13B7C
MTTTETTTPAGAGAQGGPATSVYSAAARRVRESHTHAVPEAANGPAIGRDGYTMQEIGDGDDHG